MTDLHFAFPCPLEEFAELELVIDLKMTQLEYEARLLTGEYAGLVDIRNWEAVMGETPKPVFPLTSQTVKGLSPPLIRYMNSGMYIIDGTDAYMAARLPN